jgi:hypothetical protein
MQAGRDGRPGETSSGRLRRSATLIEGDPYAQSLDESLAKRRQQLGRRHARPPDSGATPPADGHGQRDDPPDHRLLDQNRDGAARTPQAEASRLRAGSDQRKLAPTVRSRVMIMHTAGADGGPPARLSGRWRHNQHRPGEQAVLDGPCDSGLGQPPRLSKRRPCGSGIGAAPASCRKRRESLERPDRNPWPGRPKGFKPDTNFAPFRGTLCGAKRWRLGSDAGLLGNNCRHLPG